MIYKFAPIFKTTIWGGERIAPFKGVWSDLSKIGESWEISGVKDNISVVKDGPDAGISLTELIERDGARLLGKDNYKRFGTEFPLLVKFIDAAQDLSIQVHPDDSLAKKRHNSKGKTEMWYVVDASPSAHLKSGLKSALDPQAYVNAIEDNSICDKLMDYDVMPGDVFFLPAGRIHSIGAGCLIAEIQQTSDITYRIYDFNRVDAQGNTRQLHTELSKEAIDYTMLDDYRTHYSEPAEGIVPLVDCPYFNVGLTVVKDTPVALPEIDSFFIVIVTEGTVLLQADGMEMKLRRGETALVSADTLSSSLVALDSDKAKVLLAHID